MFGYKFIGWDKTAEEIKESTDDIVVTALFEKLEDTVTISVYGGTGSGEYKIKDYVTIVADAPEMGQKFSYWEDEKGNILCYDTTFKFYATRSLILAAIYVPETETIVKKASINITSITTTDDKISFVAERLIPEGNEIVSHGIIVTNNASIGTMQSDFILGKTDVLNAESNTKSFVGTFVLNKIAALNETWYARAYVIYMNNVGEVITLYSDIVDYTIS